MSKTTKAKSTQRIEKLADKVKFCRTDTNTVALLEMSSIIPLVEIFGDRQSF